MAIILYASGVTEIYEPKEHTFTDRDILSLFEDFDHVRTLRLLEVPNTWCVWGEGGKTDEGDHNKLGSEILQEDVYSPVLFIHDTQINHEWLLTDEIIYNDYQTHMKDLLRFFDEVAEHVLIETEKQRREQGKSGHLLFLTTIGSMEDKRVLFEFDPSVQNQHFYSDEAFTPFADRVYEYLNKEYKTQDTFFIFEDKKTLIYTKEDGVEFFINKLVGHYESVEMYERCHRLTEVFNKWKSHKQKKLGSRKKKINRNKINFDHETRKRIHHRPPKRQERKPDKD